LHPCHDHGPHPRAGRATRSGEAFNLITGNDKDMVRAINQLIGASIEQRTLADKPIRFDCAGIRVPKYILRLPNGSMLIVKKRFWLCS